PLVIDRLGRHQLVRRCALVLAAGIPRRRKPKPEREARAGVEHFDAGTMQAGNGRDNAQSEAAPRRGAAAFEPVKTLEDVLMLVRGKSRAVVGNGKDGAAIARRDV